MNVWAELDALLEQHGIHPVLVDVGASGGAPDIWKPIARRSIYIGFDPDLREIRRDTAGGYHSGIVVNKAVCADPAAESVSFYLTESPYCSSMLHPDAAALSQHSFWQLFEVKREVRVPATTLSKVLAGEGLDRIDWLKIDTQGADLQVYSSLDESQRARLLAVDTEPGLIDAYEGEDLFVEVHRRLRAEGFWLSNVNVMGVSRISKRAMAELRSETDGEAEQMLAGIRTSPGWCEARYFRTAEDLAARGADARQFIVAWTFAILDRQYGYALELASRSAVCGDRGLSERLKQATYAALRTAPAPAPRGRLWRLAQRINGRLRRLLS